MARWFLARPWLRIGAWVVGVTFSALATFVLARAFAARGLPDLDPWHHDPPPCELRASDLDDDVGLADYLAREDRLFAALDEYLVPPEEAASYVSFTRYIRGGPGDPETYPHDWNRTTMLEPEGEPRGGVLLLHGLTDGPYSLHHVAEIFRARGHLALSMRLPGHGTVPAALRGVRWEDWEAAARLGANEIIERIGEDRPFYVCGYSAGGALAVKMTIDAIVRGGLRVPDRLFLFSPSIGVSSFARLALVDQCLAWIPFFEKSAWLSVNPEYDPFKYNSFCLRAGYEVWQLTRENHADWTRLVKHGGVKHFPPVITFHSAVDATVSTAAVRAFHDALPANGSELVVFDVNHQPGVEGFMRRDPSVLTGLFTRPGSLAYAVSVITNVELGSPEVVVRRRPPGAGIESSETPLEAAWPSGIFSLSHVAIPFPPEDPVYGDGSGALPDGRLVIGAIVARGEKGVLSVPNDELMRMRYNPFFGYVRERIEETIDAQSIGR